MARPPAPKRRAAPTTRAKPKSQTFVIKASGASASDADIISSTIADASAGRTSSRDQEWFCYEKHPWVRACVRLIANAVSQEGFSVATIDGASFTPVTDDADPRVKEIHQYFRYCFAGRSLRTALVALVTDLLVFGLAYWLIRRQGDLVWYERQDPRLMSPILNPEHTEIISYTVKRSKPTGVGAFLDVDSLSAKTVAAKDVIRFAFEGGDTVLGGPSPLEALDLTVAMDISIRHHRNAFFRNGATHGTYILLPEASPEQAKEVEKSFKSLKTGAANAYAPVIIAGNADVKRFSDSGKQEVDFLKGSELTRDEIAAVFGIPLGKLMFAGGALGSAGKSEDDDTFQRDCVLPIEELIYETITTEVLLKEFEIDDLALIPKRRASMRTDRFIACLSMVKFGGTGNEARELAGLPKMDDPHMDEPLFIGARGATSDDPGLTKEDAPAQPEPSTGNVEGANTAKETDQKNEVAATKAKADFSKLKKRLDATTQSAIEAHEGKLAAKLIACRNSFEVDFWRRAGDLKASAVAGETSDAITHTEVLALARAIMDADGEESYSDAIYTSQEILAELGWSQGKAILDLTTGFDVVPTATLNKLREAADDFGDKINLQEKDALRLVLTKAFDDGLSVENTKSLLKQVFSEGYHSIGDDGQVERRMPTDKWSTLVSRTELSNAANSGMFDLYQSAGIQQIQWIAANSPTTCQACGDADGSVVNLGDDFPFVDVPAPTAHPACVCSTAPADEDIGSARGDKEQTDWAARGGRDKSSFEKDFGFIHPLDQRAEKAYNPDQPRDEHGRWGSGGEAQSHADKNRIQVGDFEFVKSNRSSEADRTLVKVSVDDLVSHLEPGTFDTLTPGRLDRVKAFLSENKTGIHAPRVGPLDGNIAVEDGRNRILAFSQMGVREIAVSVDKDDARSIHRSIGR